jgi:16S rRNA G966 N2-methylase RsmD
MSTLELPLSDPALARADGGAVECLGRSFPSDAARRAHFAERLRTALAELEATLDVPFTTVDDAAQRLQALAHWPAQDAARLRELAERLQGGAPEQSLLARWKDEVGFPHGSVEDIVRLSDPPYYTACPNPFIAEFLEAHGGAHDAAGTRAREPFAADVSEGKNDPIYTAHSYHTKVPHKAIMRYLLHYTEPGDVVLDAFCGTGMTGVAAQLCADRRTVEELGYRVESNGTVLESVPDESGKAAWRAFAKLGARRAVLNDLSPAATFISYNYNTPADVARFEREAKRILREVEAECGWTYATLHEPTPEAVQAAVRAFAADDAWTPLDERGATWGVIHHVVWSDVFHCPHCAHEIVFWHVAVDAAGEIRRAFPCPGCAAELERRALVPRIVARHDAELGEVVQQAEQRPVSIRYTVGRTRYEKAPDAFDLALLERLEAGASPHRVPTGRMPDGEESRRNDRRGMTHAHHFFTRRSARILAAFAARASQELTRALWAATAVTEGSSRLNRERPSGLPSKLSGTLYVSSLNREVNVLEFLKRKVRRYQNRGTGPHVLTSCHSSTRQPLPDASVDYIFTDPPFGGNLMYSELNFLWEEWLRVWTNNGPEAIQNRVQGKGLAEYKALLLACFRECYRVLKPGRWMTVEFSSTRPEVWNAIQTALEEAGFRVEHVAALDKKQRSFKAVTTPTAVKQDLVISARRPVDAGEPRAPQLAASEQDPWGFIAARLAALPHLPTAADGTLAEREPRILYDRLVAWLVRHGVPVPLSSQEFQAGLAARYEARDGLVFLPDQAAEYARHCDRAGGRLAGT